MHRLNQGTIKRQVLVEGNQVAFEAGEQVEIESVQPNLQNPAFKYVVLSQRLQKRFQLSDDDIELTQVQQSSPSEVPPAAYQPVQQVVTQQPGMKCSRCDTEYNDSFKFCPNCAETNPMVKKEEPGVVEPLVPLVGEFPILPPEPPKPKKNISERIKPVFAKIKEKINKKTIIIGVSILLLIVAVIVVAVVLTRPSYPDTIKLGDFQEGDLSVKGLTLKKGEKQRDITAYAAYEVTGTALGKWNGKATINLNLTTSKGPKTAKVDLTTTRNEKQEIRSLVLNDPLQKCEVQSISYDGKMNADDFVSIDNVTSGLTLTTGASVIAGTVKEDGATVTFNGQPVQIGSDKKFSVTTTINEGANTISFEVAEKGGTKATKTITLTGQIPPEVYRASCPGGPPYANLNKNPDSFKGTPVHYRGQVIQAMESGGTTVLRVDITPMGYGYWTDTIYVVLSGTSLDSHAKSLS